MNRFKRIVSLVLCMALAVTMLAGCESKDKQEVSTSSVSEETKASSTVSTSESTETSTSKAIESDELAGLVTLNYGTLTSVSRPSLVKGSLPDDYDGVKNPSAAVYSVKPDLSNVINADDFYMTEEDKQLLLKNGFVVANYTSPEFYQTYEFNRYTLRPSFITVDSLVHTYHLYFMKLLRSTEKNYLYQSLESMTDKLLADSLLRYADLKGTKWESAALRNVEFMAVASKLMGKNYPIPEEAKEVVESEYKKTQEAQGIDYSSILGFNEDYSQYKVRGYYEGDETLEKYFKTMMWYGRLTFPLKDDDTTRSAILLSLAITDTSASEWATIYSVTSFFAGDSDDLSVSEYMPAIIEAYGDSLTRDKLIDGDAEFAKFVETIKKMDGPAINSIPVMKTEDNAVKGFRLMGQRFTIDAYVMQNLIYRAVDENEQGQTRMLPHVLDVPAAFGSDVALEITNKEGADQFPDYAVRMETLRNTLSKIDPSVWKSSLYSQWINALRPLLTVKGSGYPAFMQSTEWQKKSLECFSGSFTELKHDTVLYSKQVMAEMGGGFEEEPDYRGYVEPEPVLYNRMSILAQETSKGLKDFNILSEEDGTNLEMLREICDILRVISEKELKNESLTEDEHEFIKSYGGQLEHLWYNAYSDRGLDGYDPSELPAALVVDIATDPSGQVLEIANGNPVTIYVIVSVDGSLRIARGTVYDFYSFLMPINQRMTDKEWQIKIHAIYDEDYDYTSEPEAVPKPDWTLSYRSTH